jgi:hypothetical protein
MLILDPTSWPNDYQCQNYILWPVGNLAYCGRLWFYLVPPIIVKDISLKYVSVLHCFTLLIDNCHFTNFIDILQYHSTFPFLAVRMHLPRTFFLIWKREWTIMGLDISFQCSDLLEFVLVLLLSLVLWSRRATCHKLAVRGDTTDWRWNAVLAQNGDGWKSLCGRECLIYTVSWFGICRTMSYLKLDISNSGVI